ncbi:LOW QUALITY PROTEIN: hypothetical protein Cgig2_020961 [Carnegiea gigantea]|uniref:Uncharacterized protein n=1 Tax=Carnegiea gigantea TaxID=171969 RepID=A0A9Q1GMB8_9CARY|nr:LOW QUALITY PROTEIN: hypothetical protein Cgig2_020961 [Carnegiea gigantea]
MGHCNLIYPGKNFDLLLANKRRNRFIIPFQLSQEQDKELMPLSLRLTHKCYFPLFAYFDDPRYRRKSLGITKYGTIEIHSIVKKEDLIEYRGVKEFQPKYLRQVDRIFFIPEEMHILPGSSPIMVWNNSLIRVDTQIKRNLRSRPNINRTENRVKGLMIGAEITIAKSPHSLVNKIQKVYRSQGMQIHNRQIEIIVRQITSKVKKMEFLIFFARRTNWVVTGGTSGAYFGRSDLLSSYLIRNNESISSYSKELFDSCLSKNFHDRSKQQ